MKACIAILVWSSVATAGALVTPPAGWTRDPKSPATSEVYLAATPGAELVVSAQATTIGVAHHAEAARAALDDLHAMSKRAAMTGTNVTEDGWQEHSDATTKLVDGMLSWRDPSSQLVETARVVIAADTQHLVAVTGECIARDDSSATLPALTAARDACKAALATLDPGIALAQRVAVAIAPPGTAPPATNSPTMGAPATMSEGHTPLAPIAVPQETPSADRRPVFVGAGIVLLAGVFWWNMRRRSRLEEEDSTDDR